MSTNSTSGVSSLFYSGDPDEEVGPLVTLRLPLDVVRALRESLRYISSNDAPPPLVPSLVIDDINHQLQQQVVDDKVYELRPLIGGSLDDAEVFVDDEYLGCIERLADGTWRGDITDGNGPPSKPYPTREQAVHYVVAGWRQP